MVRASQRQGAVMSHLNVGNLDRTLRVLAGAGLVGLAALGTIGPWGYLGVALILTGLAAICPLYSALGVATTSR
jgi:Protein of unknown function (DUF2892)